jgi:hypothetical protein
MLEQAAQRVFGLAEQLKSGGLGYHRGPVALNRLGFQVARAAYKSAGWHLRRVPVNDQLSPFVEELVRNGVVRIPNFLSSEQFAAVRAEYDRSFSTQRYTTPVVEDNNVAEELLDFQDAREAFSATIAHVVKSPTLNGVVAGALRRPLTVRPRVWSKRWHKAAEQLEAKGAGHVIGANYLHADMHYATFKAWLYLNDVDEENGAFVFSPGSHRMTPARLSYEYEASVRVAQSRRDGTYQRVPYALIRQPSPAQSRAMGLCEVSMNSKANTLIIANTQGFHRQGDFKPGLVREAIYFCFRTSEPGGTRLLGAGGEKAW